MEVIEEIISHLPLAAGQIVGLTNWEGDIMLATQYRIYRIYRDSWVTGRAHLECIAVMPDMPCPI